MLQFIKEKKNCTGCMACANECPKRCISMEKDLEGFYYPFASSECVDCGLCRAVCPQIKVQKKINYAQKAYAVLSKYYKVWKRSASGGAFSEICRALDDKDTWFFGSSWDGLTTHHVCVKSFSELELITKSKYIQSYIGDTFSYVKAHLNSGGRTVFCGTPCQIAGLKSFLKKEYSNLILIDFICHGVGSSDVLQECARSIGQQFNDEVNSYEFRAKRLFYETDHLTKVRFKSGKVKYLLNDQYMQLFLRQDCLRPSCGSNCIYRNENRLGDITVADFKGLYDIFPDLVGGKYNYSALIVNNEKGEMIVKDMRNNAVFMPCSVECIKEYNPLFYRNTLSSRNRATFFENFANNPQKTISIWTQSAIESRRSIRHILFEMAPVKLRNLVIGLVENMHDE